MENIINIQWWQRKRWLLPKIIWSGCRQIRITDFPTLIPYPCVRDLFTWKERVYFTVLKRKNYDKENDTPGGFEDIGTSHRYGDSFGFECIGADLLQGSAMMSHRFITITYVIVRDMLC